ncbi:hypothetical protein ACFE04_021544 [Oxalis oulophora]
MASTNFTFWHVHSLKHIPTVTWLLSLIKRMTRGASIVVDGANRTYYDVFFSLQINTVGRQRWCWVHTQNKKASSLFQCPTGFPSERGITVSAFLNIRGIRIMIEFLASTSFCTGGQASYLNKYNLSSRCSESKRVEGSPNTARKTAAR